MGTRSITYILDDDNFPLIGIYRQHNGDFDGVGKEMASDIQKYKLVNGFTNDDIKDARYKGITLSNGMADFAAQYIAHIKKNNPVGSVYINHVPSSTVYRFGVDESPKFYTELARHAMSSGAEYMYMLYESTIPDQSGIRMAAFDLNHIKSTEDIKLEPHELTDGVGILADFAGHPDWCNDFLEERERIRKEREKEMKENAKKMVASLKTPSLSHSGIGAFTDLL